MNYSYESKLKQENDFKKQWKQKLLLSGKKLEKQIGDLEKMGQYSAELNDLEEEALAYLRSGKFTAWSELIKTHYAELAEVCVGKRYLKDYLHIIDKLDQFSCTYSTYRRTVRTKAYYPSAEHIFSLMKDYRMLQFYDCGIADYLLDNLAPDKLEHKRRPFRFFHMYNFDELLAAAIDMEDGEVIEAARKLILSDNNTLTLTVDAIRGIVKSSNKDLHRLLADFLLAARLQEGIRQAVCENADCGTMEAFICIFDTICENNLIRFSSVKRSIAMWTGICDRGHMDRITEKMTELMRAAIRDTTVAEEYLRTNDSIQISIGLWALGAYELFDAISVMKEYLKKGTRNQILTMSYFNMTLEYESFTASVAKEAVKKFEEDEEILAAFMPTYLANTESYAREARDHKKRTISLERFFENKVEAREHYEIMKRVLSRMKKKKSEFVPCIFPWYGVFLSQSGLVQRMCAIACVLQDNTLIGEMAEKLVLIDAGGYRESRSIWVELLLRSPADNRQRQLLLGYMADKDGLTRKAAYRLVKKLDLEETEYQTLEGYLKYKSGDIRRNVLSLLEKQEDEALLGTVKRLLSSSLEEMKDGGLSLILEIKKAGKDADFIKKCTEEAEKLSAGSDKEQILLKEITGRTGESVRTAQKVQNARNGSRMEYLPLRPDHRPDWDCIKRYFEVPARELDRIVDKLIELLNENAELEYQDMHGNEVLLGNKLTLLNCDSPEFEDWYPFKELWTHFYEQEIGDPHLLRILLLIYDNRITAGEGEIERKAELLSYEKKLLGSGIIDYHIPDHPFVKETGHVRTIFRILAAIYEGEKEKKENRRAARALADIIGQEIPDGDLWYGIQRCERESSGDQQKEYYAITDIPAVQELLRLLEDWEDDEEFAENFRLLALMDHRFDYNTMRGKETADYGERTSTWLNIYHYVKACAMGILSKEAVCQAAFENLGLYHTLASLSCLVYDHLDGHDRNCLRRFISEEELNGGKSQPAGLFAETGRDIYLTLTGQVLDVELKRGEMKTEFSYCIFAVRRIFGVERLIEILKAFGNGKPEHETYYYRQESREGRKACLSHLLQVCWPAEGEDSAAKLRQLLTGTRIREQRLIETAMYSPQWIPVVGEYLGWPGFISGCYYFIAHMNEAHEERDEAVIARYTPLTPEELMSGAFDTSWFAEVYGLLGEERFNRLYDAAKYISGGGKHTRARKYADAALGKTTVTQLEAVIREKRNKDLLMSYGLAPMENRADLIHRYEFLQEFLKESRQFGMQRRAGEAAAVSTALKNLATAAGFADVTRLTLAAETELVTAYQAYYEAQAAEEVLLQLSTDEYGKTEIHCEKDGKTLKSVPPKIKKSEVYIKLKEIRGKLNEQRTRAIKMFEQSMEEQEIYSFGELRRLCGNPVIRPVLSTLVFATADTKHGFLIEQGLEDCYGEKHLLREETAVRVAHPCDLYQAGCWQEYQRDLFAEAAEKGVKKQPFRQIFRELYVKLPEELEKEHSMMFAGNQIQVSKAVACLKSRRWIADYKEGLQKVFYKENLVARIYALADWFSPGDIEAPTLEWVEFTDRRTLKSVKIKEIPDIIYSEVMRDVDLAVSVAHAGGVDPETSHSTIEMRRTILEYSLPLFRISNVRLKDSHALIEGKRGSYSIHLGSGTIHRLGGHQIHVLPVHSQGRGKIFLPFLDEDFKTAEIISKVVLFASDQKIKDPYILRQIV